MIATMIIILVSISFVAFCCLLAGSREDDRVQHITAVYARQLADDALLDTLVRIGHLTHEERRLMREHARDSDEV